MIWDMYLYWIYSANNCGVLFSWGVSVCPLGTRLGPVHVLRYVFVLDIFCQQLWSLLQLGGVCVPFGHKVGACTCFDICIWLHLRGSNINSHWLLEIQFNSIIFHFRIFNWQMDVSVLTVVITAAITQTISVLSARICLTAQCTVVFLSPRCSPSSAPQDTSRMSQQLRNFDQLQLSHLKPLQHWQPPTFLTQGAMSFANILK